ncbi:MAG: hypothetical protein Q8M37_02270 [Nevskia sp.]|nr:hypothetical protein [Nevskia sp.]
MIEAIVGVLVGLGTIAFARQIRGEHWVYALSLISLPTIYAGFAWLAGETSIGFQEMLFGLPFLIGGVVLTLARQQFRWAAAIVGALWLAHGGYDLLHPQWFINPGVPAWYPAFCASVDIVVGLYLLSLAASPARRDLQTA